MSEKTEEQEPIGDQRKFDAWLAGATEAQAERWKRMQAAAPVKDDELPPALRGGALEVF